MSIVHDQNHVICETQMVDEIMNCGNHLETSREELKQQKVALPHALLDVYERGYRRMLYKLNSPYSLPYLCSICSFCMSSHHRIQLDTVECLFEVEDKRLLILLVRFRSWFRAKISVSESSLILKLQFIKKSGKAISQLSRTPC